MRTTKMCSVSAGLAVLLFSATAMASHYHLPAVLCDFTYNANDSGHAYTYSKSNNKFQNTSGAARTAICPGIHDVDSYLLDRINISVSDNVEWADCRLKIRYDSGDYVTYEPNGWDAAGSNQISVNFTTDRGLGNGTAAVQCELPDGGYVYEISLNSVE